MIGEPTRIYADTIVDFSQSSDVNLIDPQTGESITLEEFVNDPPGFLGLEISSSAQAALFNASAPNGPDDLLVLTTGSSVTLGFANPITVAQGGVNVPSFVAFSQRDGLQVEVRPVGGDFIEISSGGFVTEYSFLESPIGNGPVTIAEIRLTATAPENVAPPFFTQGYRYVDNVEVFGILSDTPNPLPVPPTSEDPVANDDIIDVPLNETLFIDVLANDTFDASDPPIISISSPPEFGQAFAVDGQIRYVPPAREDFKRSDGADVYTNFFGPDPFEYRISASDGGNDTAQVLINVDGPDLALIGETETRVFEGNQAFRILRTWQDDDVVALFQEVTNRGAPIDLSQSGNVPFFEFALSPVSGPDFFLAYSLTRPFPLQNTLPNGGIFGTGEQYEYQVAFRIDFDNPEFPTNHPGYYQLLTTFGTQTFQERGTENNFSPLAQDALKVLITDRSLIEITLDTFTSSTIGTGDNDTVINSSGADHTVDGGAGRDTFVSDTLRERGQLLIDLLSGPGQQRTQESGNSDNQNDDSEDIQIELSGPLSRTSALTEDEVIVFTDLETGVTTTLQNVERVALADGVYVFDLEGEDLEYAYRIYDAAFGRTPDEAGLTFWNDQMNRGNVDRDSLAQFFVDSPEFESLYPTSSDAEFITALYENALRRAPDDPGFEFWSDAFATGQLSRSDMLVFFADSPENIARNADNYDDGIWVVG